MCSINFERNLLKILGNFLWKSLCFKDFGQIASYYFDQIITAQRPLVYNVRLKSDLREVLDDIISLQIQVILYFIQESHDDNEIESESGEEDIDWKSSTKKVPKKKGRKSQWSTNLTNDLIDMILEDDRLKKLSLTNVKNSKNSEYYEKVIKELKERCQARGEVFD